MPNVVPLRARFPRGCRVRFSAAWHAARCFGVDVPAVVTGYARNEQWLYIRQDGNSASRPYHHTFLEPIDEDTPQVSRVCTTVCQACETPFRYTLRDQPRRYCSRRCGWVGRQRLHRARQRTRHA